MTDKEFTGPYKTEEVILLDSGASHILVSDCQGNPLVEAFNLETAEEVIRRLEAYEKQLVEENSIDA